MSMTTDRATMAYAHGKNRKQIRSAITQANRGMNTGIRNGDKPLEYTNIRISAILYAAYLEAHLGFVLDFYSSKISAGLRTKVLEQRSEVARWEFLLDAMYRIQYLNGKRKALNLGHTNFNRFVYVKRLLDVEVNSIIEIRNKLAHGQWSVAFTTDGSGKNQQMTSKIWTLDKKDIMAMKQIVNAFCRLTENLIISKSEVAKNFDSIVHRLEDAKLIQQEQYGWILDEIRRRKRAPSQSE